MFARARLMQSRALAARVSGARGARCTPFTAPVGVLVEITLHVQHHGSCCALSARVFALALRERKHEHVSVSRRFSSLPALCSRLCRHLRLVSAGALLSLLSSLFELCLVFAFVLLLSLLSTLLPSLLCFSLISPRLASRSSRDLLQT